MYKNPISEPIDVFRNTFIEVSKHLQTQLESEKQANQHNMDSGIPLEDYFRERFGQYIPNEFSVDVGTIVDRERYSCGDCDFVIYDPRFAPFLKFPATSSSRRKFIAFETTYGIIEVKQTLTLGAVKDGKLKNKPRGSMYEAFKKMFAYKELEREGVDASRFIPGAVISGLKGDKTLYNKPFALAFFYDTDLNLSNELELRSLLEEYWLINRSVSPSIRVNGLFVLDKFSIVSTQASNVESPSHIVCLHPDESPNMFSLVKSGEDTLYFMYTLLWNLLLSTRLVHPNLNADYGGGTYLQNFEQVLVSIDS